MNICLTIYVYKFTSFENTDLTKLNPTAEVDERDAEEHIPWTVQLRQVSGQNQRERPRIRVAGTRNLNFNHTPKLMPPYLLFSYFIYLHSFLVQLTLNACFKLSIWVQANHETFLGQF